MNQYTTTHWHNSFVKGIIFIPILLLLNSCLKKEPLWKLPPPGNEIVTQIDMGETYNTTIFFKFKTNTQIQRDINTFHIAFESNTKGYRVKINGGINVQVYNTHSTDFSKAFNTSTSNNWSFDLPNGNMDSTAIGNWLSDTTAYLSKNEVYVIDLGTNAVPKYKKLVLQNVTDTSYTLKHANLDNSNMQLSTLKKSTTATFTYFNLSTNTTVNYEPAPLDYDIIFTKYKHIFYEDGTVIPYSVNGALLNPKSTAASKIKNLTFDSLSIADANEFIYSTAADIIGHNWKYFDLDKNKYNIIPNLYVVKDCEGVLWKLEFIDFYNEAGIKGAPKFRFQRL